MKLSFLSCFNLVLIIIPIILLDKPTEASDGKYEACKKQVRCGDASITYPFYDRDNRPDYCGYPGFQFSCNNDKAEIFMSSSEIYNLIKMDATSHRVTVVRDDYWKGYCPQKPPDFDALIMNWELFNLTPADANVTLYYGCDPSNALPWMETLNFSCPGLFGENVPEAGYFMTAALEAKNGDFPSGLCQANITVPFNESVVSTIFDVSGLQAAFNSGFELEWFAENDSCDACQKSGGECGSDAEKFACYSKNTPPLLPPYRYA